MGIKDKSLIRDHERTAKGHGNIPVIGDGPKVILYQLGSENKSGDTEGDARAT